MTEPIGITGPLRLVEHAESFEIKDRTGTTLCYVYFRTDPATARAANALTEPVARRFAEAILRLPELLTAEMRKPPSLPEE